MLIFGDAIARTRGFLWIEMGKPSDETILAISGGVAGIFEAIAGTIFTQSFISYRCLLINLLYSQLSCILSHIYSATVWYGQDETST